MSPSCVGPRRYGDDTPFDIPQKPVFVKSLSSKYADTLPYGSRGSRRSVHLIAVMNASGLSGGGQKVRIPTLSRSSRVLRTVLVINLDKRT